MKADLLENNALKIVGESLIPKRFCPASPTSSYGAGVRCAAPASVITEKALAWLDEARSGPGVWGVMGAFDYSAAWPGYCLTTR